MNENAIFSEARKKFHATLVDTVLKTDKQGIPNNADRHSRLSIAIALGIIKRLGSNDSGVRWAGQMAGCKFEEICKKFLEETFLQLQHLRPGKWEIGRGGGRMSIAQFEQYDHLSALEKAAQSNPELAAALGTDYVIKPDIVIVRYPEEDDTVNAPGYLVSENEARLTSLRKINNPKPVLHASISCKWTIRSDRAQNSRSEGLNLVRNRKGRLPHIVVITGEPMPGRLASIALGTGDIDCVYHFALPELMESVIDCGYEDSIEMLKIMIQGKRLRDIADLPLDLVI